ncbi:MAG TPA: hypothetical protein DGB32_02745 [Dehalococcoidia bacterium]|nr:hypothetical protein [Dehalococcoidia bacterium]
METARHVIPERAIVPIGGVRSPPDRRLPSQRERFKYLVLAAPGRPLRPISSIESKCISPDRFSSTRFGSTGGRSSGFISSTIIVCGQ